MGVTTGYAGQLLSGSASIANSAATSGAVDLGGYTLVGLLFPAAFTGTAMAFTVSDSLAGTYVPLYNSAGAVSYTVAQGHFVAIDPKDFYGVRFIKLVSGSTEGGARTVVFAAKGF